MRIAIIDLGTNSVRFDVHDISNGEATRLHREKLMVRLGDGLFETRELTRESMERTLQAFSSFRDTAQALQVQKTIAVATSAVREAKNGASFIAQIEKRTGITVQTISGSEEARLIAEGVLNNENELPNTIGLVDIGGGSTEISICKNSEVISSVSLPLGALRLHQMYLKSNPPKRSAKSEHDSIVQLREHIQSELNSAEKRENWPRTQTLVGTSGTARSLIRLRQKDDKNSDENSFSREFLQKTVKSLSVMSIADILELPGMEPGRADIILAGAILLDEIMETLKAVRVIVSDFNLRDGLLEEQKRQLKKTPAPAPHTLRVEQLVSRARRLGTSRPRLEHVQNTSEVVFDRLKRVHNLPTTWKPYLVAAAVLHDTGRAISPVQVTQHVTYLVQEANLPDVSAWERDFLSQLCIRQKSGKVKRKDTEGWPQKSTGDAFVKLLALLRLTGVLSFETLDKPKIEELKVRRSSVFLRIRSQRNALIHVLRLNQRKDLFEKVFGKALVIEAA